MSAPGSYHCLDAFIDHDQVGYDDDGILCQLWEFHKVCVRQERMEPHAFYTRNEDPIPASLL